MGDVLSIILGAGPDSSVKYCLDGGWSREAHLLANLQEANSGLATLQQPYARPGIESRPEKPQTRDILHGEAMTWEEMDARDAQRAAAAASNKPRTTRKATW